jgi:hypothetical protein
MVGKPNFVPDAEQRSNVHGAATRPTPGLTPLDEEREASLADEGGTSGAVMESDGEERPRVLHYDDKHPERMCEDDITAWRRRLTATLTDGRVVTGALAGMLGAVVVLLLRSRLR